MVFKKAGSTIALILIFLNTARLSAQEKKNTDAANTTQKKGSINIDRIILLPEFYHYKPVIAGDTTYKYECYHRDHSGINVDTLHNINDVHEIFYLKSYYKFQTPPGSIISAPYLSISLFVYERSSDDTWVGIDRKSDYKIGIKEFKNKIVSSDTAIVTNHLTGKQETIIHKYYKIQKVDYDDVPHSHEHEHK